MQTVILSISGGLPSIPLFYTVIPEEIYRREDQSLYLVFKRLRVVRVVEHAMDVHAKCWSFPRRRRTHINASTRPRARSPSSARRTRGTSTAACPPRAPRPPRRAPRRPRAPSAGRTPRARAPRTRARRAAASAGGAQRGAGGVGEAVQQVCGQRVGVGDGRAGREERIQGRAPGGCVGVFCHILAGGCRDARWCVRR